MALMFMYNTKSLLGGRTKSQSQSRFLYDKTKIIEPKKVSTVYVALISQGSAPDCEIQEFLHALAITVRRLVPDGLIFRSQDSAFIQRHNQAEKNHTILII